MNPLLLEELFKAIRMSMPSTPSRELFPQSVQSRAIMKASLKRAKRAERNMRLSGLLSTTSKQGEEKAI